MHTLCATFGLNAHTLYWESESTSRIHTIFWMCVCTFVTSFSFSICLNYIYDVSDHTNHIFSEILSSGDDNDWDKDLHKDYYKDKDTQTNTNTKCFQDPMYAIFFKHRGFKDLKYYIGSLLGEYFSGGEYFLGVNIFQEWIFFRDEYFLWVNIFQGWIFFRGEYFSGVNTFQGWIFFRGEYFLSGEYFSEVNFFRSESFSVVNIF